jgi:hypothetical protein
MLSPFLMGSPEAAQRLNELWNRLRPVKYTPEEEKFGEIMEEMVSFAGEVAATAGAGSLVKAESAGVRVAMRAGARQAAKQAGQQAVYQATEQAALNTVEGAAAEGAELGGSRVSELLARAGARLNPFNYRVCGVSCGGGGIEFKPPSLTTATTTTAEAAEVAEAESVQAVPANRPPQVLGRGSTANLAKDRTLPGNLREQLAVEQAMAEPEAGEVLPLKMGDPRWPGSEGWVKMQQKIMSGDKDGSIIVHYVRNTRTGEIDDFKIVLQQAKK